MKKIITIISIAASAMVMVFSCSKEEEKQKVIKSNDPEAIDAYNRIMNFKNKVAYYKENPGLKSGETMSLDSLLWQFNAILNFDYSEVDDPYKQFYTKTVYSEISISADLLIEMDEVMNVYHQLENEIQNTLNAAPFNDKAVQFTFVKVDSIANQILTLSSSIAVGEKGTDGTGPFTTNDDWRYGNDLGDCYGNYYWERDAADEIRDMVEFRRHLFINEPPGTFYVNPTEILLGKFDIDNNTLLNLTNGQGYDNIRDYRLFYVHPDHNNPPGGSIEQFDCISDYNMNFYNSQMEYLIYTLMPNSPSHWPGVYNKTFIRFDTIIGRDETDGSNNTYYIHKPEIIFAQKFTIEQ